MTRPSRGERESIAFRRKNERLDRPMRFNLNLTDIAFVSRSLRIAEKGVESASISDRTFLTRGRKALYEPTLRSVRFLPIGRSAGVWRWERRRSAGQTACHHV